MMIYDLLLTKYIYIYNLLHLSYIPVKANCRKLLNEKTNEASIDITSSFPDFILH